MVSQTSWGSPLFSLCVCVSVSVCAHEHRAQMGKEIPTAVRDPASFPSVFKFGFPTIPPFFAPSIPSFFFSYFILFLQQSLM